MALNVGYVLLNYLSLPLGNADVDALNEWPLDIKMKALNRTK